MIYSVLNIIGERLNFYLKNRFALGEDKVILSNIVNQDGSLAITESDKVVITLVNIQEETVSSRLNSSVNMARPINLNIYVMCSAYFTDKNYPEALKFLSATLSFFQSNCVFTHSNTPDLNRNIEKLTFEIVNQDLQNQSHLWGTLGGKYLPSILYKVRMVTIQEGNFEDDYTRVSGFSSIV
ncbi:DUF4255 domain-containing protein [Sporocytophaga myxococcoides]|uniref:DUF4255 domain-containing protein n=1 Tax=Sporocytophaga myxococcoides TaxID=153721 RepID=UPI0003F821F4|nr:DUF4255 domain-containing protein [Sporocytophaga myxococcoides]